MTELCELAIKNGTDKVPPFHDYTPVYHELFKDRRDIKKVFEMGIGSPQTVPNIEGYKSGGSLRMWAEYFPQAEIYAADIDCWILVDTDRIHSFQCDQGNQYDLRELSERIGDNFDLMVDDGSHRIEHQILTAKILVPLLAPKGIYVIEDVTNPDLILEVLEHDPSNPICRVIKFDNPGIYRDNRLVIIEGG